MIQFNLLPDIKVEYIKANRLKRTMLAISVLAASASLALVVLLYLGVGLVQKRQMNNLAKDLSSSAKTLENIPNINTILTVQNQLNSLTGLHDTKPAAPRLFEYLGQITPSSVSISNVSIDYTAHTLTITGAGKDLLAVNTFIDTLKFTTFKSQTTADKSAAAFTKVTLTSFSAGEKNANYQTNLSFDPALFDSLQKITLVVPNTITTRSEINQPTSLFQQEVKTDNKAGR